MDESRNLLMIGEIEPCFYSEARSKRPWLEGLGKAPELMKIKYFHSLAGRRLRS